MANDLTKIKRTWNAGAKNGAAKLMRILVALEKTRDHGDWTDAAWTVGLSIGTERKRVQAVIEGATGMTFKVCKKQPSGYKLASKGTAETNRLATLGAYVEAGTPLLSDAMCNDEGIPALLDKKEPKLRTVEEIILAAIRKARRENPEQATDARLQQAFGDGLRAD